MHLPSISPLVLLLPLTIAAPTLQPSPQLTSPTLPSWTINNFSAYSSPSFSWIFFVLDSDSLTSGTNCRICTVSSNTSIYDSIYASKMQPCGGKPSMWFQIEEEEVVLRGTWKSNTGDWVTGIAPQGTYWKEGEGGNVTEQDGGRSWTRTLPWDFPIETRIS